MRVGGKKRPAIATRPSACLSPCTERGRRRSSPDHSFRGRAWAWRTNNNGTPGVLQKNERQSETVRIGAAQDHSLRQKIGKLVTDQTNGPAGNPDAGHNVPQMALPWSCGPTSATRICLRPPISRPNGAARGGPSAGHGGPRGASFRGLRAGRYQPEPKSTARLGLPGTSTRPSPAPRVHSGASATTTTTLAPDPSAPAPKGHSPRGIGSEADVAPAQAAALMTRASLTEALPVTPPGGALDHLVIPAIGVDRYVVQGVAEADLQDGPGPLPGDTVAWSGRQRCDRWSPDHLRGPFFRLNEVHSGDLVYLTDTLGTTWVYRVVSQFVVAPSDVAVLDATQAPELTLTTCNPRFEATSRLVVRAVLLTHLARGTRVPKPLPVEATKDGGFPRVIGRSDPCQDVAHLGRHLHSHVTSHLHLTSHATTTAPDSGPPPAPATTRPTSSTLPTSGTSSAKTTSGGRLANGRRWRRLADGGAKSRGGFVEREPDRQR